MTEKFAKQTVNSLSSYPLTLLSSTISSLSSLKKAAFTLAEVLITLGIIGVVAAVTMPTLIAEHREKVTVTRLNSTYSLLSQAVQQMVADETTIENWRGTREERVARFEELLPKYLQIVKVCPKRTKGCMAPNGYSNRFNTLVLTSNEGVSNSYLLKNGAGIRIRYGGTCQQDMTLTKKGCDEGDEGCSMGAIRNYGTYAHNCIRVFIDINGPAKPNKFDVDTFYFPIVQDGIVPGGSSKERIWTETFENQCLGKNIYLDGGAHCSAWVIYNKNMDYLHCPDKLGWNKASRCKD